MDALSVPLPILAGCLFAAGLVFGVRAWRRPGSRRAFLACHPAWRAFLRGQRLSEPEQFLDLPALIVSGHPDRNVARVTFGQGTGAVVVYLKREQRVSWRVRWSNFFAGFGLVSRSLREAQTLQALEREGLSGPEWLAVGEDDRGRAFLLVRAVPDALELPTALARQPDLAARRALARRIGSALARLHEAGFEHRDLYAKHVLLSAQSGTVHFIDWARARRRAFLSARVRARDLAALHATLADALVGRRERLLCLAAYVRALPGPARPAWRDLLARARRRARHLLGHRHVREKRQVEAQGEPQGWVCLDGEALCVTPALQRLCPAGLGWLALDRQPALASPAVVARRWLELPGDRLGLLVRRCVRRPLAHLWVRLTGQALSAPEQEQATLLLRLERHAVPAPRVLAMGQRQVGPGALESFLLTEPARDTTRLEAWLAGPPRGPAPAVRRQNVLRQTGALLHRLHEASCYFGPEAMGGLAVRQGAGMAPELVLDSVESVSACRGRRPRRARRDRDQLRQRLRALGCSEEDVRLFREGYERPGLGPPSAPASQAQRAEERAGAPALPEGGGPGLPPSSVSGPPPMTRATVWQRLLWGARRLRQQQDWDEFAGPHWAERIMEVEVTDRFHAKQGRSTGRWVLHAPAPEGQPTRRLAVYLKRHYQLPWWQGLLAALWPRGDWSPAFQEWNHLEWARRQGLPVPAIVAAGEWTGPGLRLQSFLAVEELTDMLPLHEAIPLASAHLAPREFRRWKRGLAAEMARLARMLHDRRCFHKDLYLCHFYVHRDDVAGLPEGAAWAGRVRLIDLHRLAHHPWTWRLWQLKDLAQLLYSSEVAGVDARDQVCFWRSYRGPSPRSWSDRWLRRCVLFKWRRYRQHNLRRKARLNKDEA